MQAIAGFSGSVVLKHTEITNDNSEPVIDSEVSIAKTNIRSNLINEISSSPGSGLKKVDDSEKHDASSPVINSDIGIENIKNNSRKDVFTEMSAKVARRASVSALKNTFAGGVVLKETETNDKSGLIIAQGEVQVKKVDRESQLKEIAEGASLLKHT